MQEVIPTKYRKNPLTFKIKSNTMYYLLESAY